MRRMMEKEMKTRTRMKRMSSEVERNEGLMRTTRMMRTRWTPRSRRRTTMIKGSFPAAYPQHVCWSQWRKGLKT